METITIKSLSLKPNSKQPQKQKQKQPQPWLYCLIATNDQTHCTKSTQISSKDWTQMIGSKNKLQFEIAKNYVLFRLEIWDYDAQRKLGETAVTGNGMFLGENHKEFSVNLGGSGDRRGIVRLVYMRKQKVQQPKQSQLCTLRVSYNKSDPNLKLGPKPTSAYPKKTPPIPTSIPIPMPTEQFQITPKYDPTAYPKWRVIPTRNDINSQRLKL